MDTLTLCGWSAFQWHRIPPLVRMLYLSGIEEDAPLATLLDADAGPLFGGIDYPLHVLAADVAHKPHRPGIVVPHLCVTASHRACDRICRGLYACDPLTTLLTLSRQLGPEKIALACSELCGSFSIFQPPRDLQPILDQLYRGDCAAFGDAAEELMLEVRHGWQQAHDMGDRPTDLWKRPRRLDLHSIMDFAAHLPEEAKGKRSLMRAAQLAVEQAASPLEVMAGILLSQPRRRGGEGLGPALCNMEIPLNEPARRIAGQRTCYGDLCFKGRRGRIVDIECHSKTWHAGNEKTVSDMTRATAIECMGIEVMFLTDSQLRDDAQAAEIARSARQKLGIKQADPSVRLLEKRQELRREVLVDWRTFQSSSLY